jgi:predicted lactoylglutathione lyase
VSWQPRVGAAIWYTFWRGYSGYFQDPDGHLWEVVWNPQLAIKE